MLWAVNHSSATKVCCLQGIKVRCQNCVVVIELGFDAEIVLLAANQGSLQKWCCVLSAEILFSTPNKRSFSKLFCLHLINVLFRNYVVGNEFEFVTKIRLPAMK